MRIMSECSGENVLRHWEQVDLHKECPHVAFWRNRIWSPLPSDIRWYEAEVEKGDLERIFIISSDEWSELSATFRLIDISEGLSKAAHSYIVAAIHDMVARLRAQPNSVDTKLIIVSPSSEGNYTAIDGNKRLVALYNTSRLIGTRVYLGVSPKIKDYSWAARAMLHQDWEANKAIDHSCA